MNATNELLDFDAIVPANLKKQVDEAIERNNQRIAQLIKDAKDDGFELSWDKTAAKLDDWDEEIFDNLFSVAGHLKSVCDNPELRKAYNACLPQISAYSTALQQNKDIFLLLKKLRETGDINQEQKQVLDNYLRDARLAGIELEEEQRKEFAKLVIEKSRLSTKFGENVMDSTDKWKKHIKDKSALSGIPKAMQDKYQADAKKDKKDGYILGLDMPSLTAVMTYADDEALREEFYRASTTRASTDNEIFQKYDNAPVIQELMIVRHKMTKMLGFDQPASMLMATNMLTKAIEVKDFLHNLLGKLLPQARHEAQELKSFVLKHKDTFHPWDLAYYSEKLRQEKFNVDKEKLRDYFPLDKVLDGTFMLIEKIFGLSLVEVHNKDFSSWHEDVRLFKLVNQDKAIIGYLYCDLFARKHKNGGAWMNESKIRRIKTDGSVQLPAAYLVCNFRPPSEGRTLLLHEEVEVLFHELGHCMHHLLTKINYRDISGINGVPHDAVEVPSQLMENWCWDKEFIKHISEHYKTGEPLDPKLLDDLIRSRNFNSGLVMLRQIEFSLFDIMLHSDPDMKDFADTKDLAQEYYDKLRNEYNPLPQIAENRFPNAFSHIFAGGYAAGYYSYKWSEVMSADIYSMFEERGIYDKTTADSLKQNIFESGGLGDALEKFIATRGRKPNMDAFLRYNGIEAGIGAS